MQERRTRRSESREEALQLLMEALAERLCGRGVALVDDRGLLLAGAGRPSEMWGLARAVSRPFAGLGRVGSRPVVSTVRGPDERLRLCGVGLDARGASEAARSVKRILSRCA